MKKMVLVPYEQYTNQKNDLTIRTSEKRNDVSESNPLIKEKSEDISISEKGPQKLSKDRILQGFGKLNKIKANSLLSYVDEGMDWNEKGELIANNVTHTGSHVTDLLNHALVSKSWYNPIGVEVFYTGLQNAPKSLFHASRQELIGKGLEQKYTPTHPPTHLEKESTPTPPPPGLPINNKTTPLNLSDPLSWKNKWRKI